MRVANGDRVLHNFSSNDYLGFAGAADEDNAAGIGAAGTESLSPSMHGTGSGASALVTGYQPVHRDLENALADWLGREAALLTSSGFLANLAVLTALAGRGDTIVQDRLCHASLIDAARLSGATHRRYAHGDLEAVERRLATATGHTVLVTDGVFSMDGDVAPLAGLAKLAARARATLVVDDAHGLGVLGQTGGGLCESEALGPDVVPVLIGTLGKAFGCAGAFIAGSRDLVEHLENHARSVIYSTALAPITAATALTALARIRCGGALRARLRDNIDHFRRGAAERDIALLPSHTPIQPLVIGDDARALAVSAALEDAGYLVTAIRPPTVPEGTSRLRITLSAAHEPAQIDGLLGALAAVHTAAGQGATVSAARRSG